MQTRCPALQRVEAIEHPLDEQDVLCLEQSDGPNKTTCSSVKTFYSFIFTISSSLEDKNTYFFNFQVPFKNRIKKTSFS